MLSITKHTVRSLLLLIVCKSSLSAAGKESTSLSEIPVLCYHQVRNWSAHDPLSAKPYIVSVEKFTEQIQMLHDSGYHTILPSQLRNYLQHKSAIPNKPILLTFDDGTISQYSNAFPALEKYGFKAIFFIMTVTLGKPNYLSRNHIIELSLSGHDIGCHTWDHHAVATYANNDWKVQVGQPKILLQNIIGKPIESFAYPYGIWSTNAINKLKDYQYQYAFQLFGPVDTANPHYTIRRIIVDGNWSTQQLSNAIKNNFKKTL